MQKLHWFSHTAKPCTIATVVGNSNGSFPEPSGFFASYYDYYQPEAYIPVSNTCYRKDLSINEMNWINSGCRQQHKLLSGRRILWSLPVWVVFTVLGNRNRLWERNHDRARSCIQGFPAFLCESITQPRRFYQGNFSRVKGDTVDINPPYVDFGYRISFFGERSKALKRLSRAMAKVEHTPFPAALYLGIRKTWWHRDQCEIQDECGTGRILQKSGKLYWLAQRISERVNYDLEMIRNLVSVGIENYSASSTG